MPVHRCPVDGQGEGMIRIETSKRRGIANNQFHDVTDLDRHRHADRLLHRQFPRATPRTREPTVLYNCHGLTFACRRARIFDPKQIHIILEDDNYKEVALPDVKGGDIVLYFDDRGDFNHSGIVLFPQVRENDSQFMVFSKWGNGREYIHLVNECPPVYGPQFKFYRCEL